MESEIQFYLSIIIFFQLLIVNHLIIHSEFLNVFAGSGLIIGGALLLCSGVHQLVKNER